METKQIQSQRLQGIQLHRPTENRNVVVLEMKTQQASQYYTVAEDALPKLIGLLQKAADKEEAAQ